MKTAIVTTSTRSRLPEVAMLARSIEMHHPGQQLTCYLAEADVRPSDIVVGNLIVEGLDVLKLPNYERFVFQYPPFELCCAIKPFAMLHAFAKGVDRVVYLDGDMFVCAPFLDSLDHSTHDILLTPHLGCAERETDYTYFLRAGTHNAGFLSAVKGARATALLSWWAARMETLCFHDYVAGVFADQSWLSLGAALFDGVGRIPDCGINVGHWNLNEHSYCERNDRIEMEDGSPLRMFHFSGFIQPGLTRHATVLESVPPAIEHLAATYGRLLSEARGSFGGDAPYSFGCFADGTPISPEMREAVRAGLVDSPHPFTDRGAVEETVRRLGADKLFASRADFRVAAADRLRIRIDELDQANALLTRRAAALRDHVDSYRRRPVRTFVHDALHRGAQAEDFPDWRTPTISDPGLPRVSILVVTRNNERTLQRAVAACFAQRLSAGTFEIVLVDDGSDAPQKAVLDELEATYRGAVEAGTFRIVRCAERRGVGPRRNMSVREARADLLAVIDGDAFPEAGWLEHVVESFAEPSVGVVSSRVLFGADPTLANGQGCTVSLYGFGLDRFVFQPVANLPDAPEEVLYAMGCGMAMRRAAWARVNGFDEDIVYGYEDVDFSLRVWIAGGRVVTNPRAVVRHETISFDPPTRDRIFLYMRNRWLFLIKHWPLTWLAKAAVCQLGALVLTQDGRVHSPIFLRAMLSLLRGLPRLLRMRRKRADTALLRRLIWPHFVPPGLYRDIRLLHGAPLTPVRRVNWNDGDTFRLGGGFLHSDGPSVSLINNGWCEVAVFSSTRALELALAPATEQPVSISIRFGVSTAAAAVTCRRLVVERAERCVIEVPPGSDRCRITVSAEGIAGDAVAPNPIVRLTEMVQS
jgi:GT2 family glycosyltransferase